MSDRGPTKELSPSRVAGRARFCKLLAAHLHDALDAGVKLVPAWAASLGVGERYVRKQAEPLREARAQLAVGDLFALPAADRLALLRRMVDATEQELAPAEPAEDPLRFVLGASIAAGDVSEEVRRSLAPTSAGGRVVVAAEWRAIASKLAAGETFYREAKHAAEAAASKACAGGGRG